MNKSTPLSQLPNSLPQTSFVNEQQKQMVTNAQNAIQTMHLPQNTQVSSDISTDDDATIQEVLNQINMSSTNLAQQVQQQQAPPNIMQMQQQQQMQMPPMQPPPMNVPMDLSYVSQPNIDQLMMQMQQQPVQLPQKQSPSNSFELFINFFADDLKMALLVFVVVIVVHFVPLSSILNKYIAIDKIPYHDVILKALLAAVAVIVVHKFIMK